jgi:hypothetical protein
VEARARGLRALLDDAEGSRLLAAGRGDAALAALRVAVAAWEERVAVALEGGGGTV